MDYGFSAISGLTLSAPKTVICPKTVTILGWVWSEGKLSASSHKGAYIYDVHMAGGRGVKNLDSKLRMVEDGR